MEIKARGLTVAYDEKVIIENLDLDIDKNEIITIIGPNGCGKSTLLKTITRILKKKNGDISLDGNDLQLLSTKEIAKKLAILSQTQSLPPDITVEELVSYGRIPHQKWFEKDSDEDKIIINQAIKMTKLETMKKRNVNSLSGGEKQRAWIATALAQKPKILFLDEPTTYLDVSHQLDVMNLVKQLNKESGIGIVMVLHDIVQAMEVSDRVIVMKKGQIYSQGSAKAVITPQMLEDVYKVDASIIEIGEYTAIRYNKVID